MNRALLQQALDALAADQHFGDYDDLCAAIRAELAKPEPEPEPEYWQWRKKDERWCIGEIYRYEVSVTTDDCEVRKLYTYPAAQPAPVPLTDEQIDKLPWGPHEGNPMTFAEGLRDFARAIERAHGITPPEET